VAKTPEAPAADEQDSPVGKGRPTPTRAEREAARKRPLVDDSKEARQRARADLNAARDRARDGMARGEEKFLPPRDKGPQRRWVRDYVDAGFHLGELVMPLMIIVILVSLVPVYALQTYAFLGLWVFIIFVIGDMIILGNNVKKKIGAKFGVDRREKGLGWYAAMRSMQMRWMRLPKPQVRRREYPEGA